MLPGEQCLSSTVACNTQVLLYQRQALILSTLHSWSTQGNYKAKEGKRRAPVQCPGEGEEDPAQGWG